MVHCLPTCELIALDSGSCLVSVSIPSYSHLVSVCLSFHYNILCTCIGLLISLCFAWLPALGMCQLPQIVVLLHFGYSEGIEPLHGWGYMCVSMSCCALGTGHGCLLANEFGSRHFKTTSVQYMLFMPTLLRKYPTKLEVKHCLLVS